MGRRVGVIDGDFEGVDEGVGGNEGYIEGATEGHVVRLVLLQPTHGIDPK